jgi:hypothetical protein
MDLTGLTRGPMQEVARRGTYRHCGEPPGGAGRDHLIAQRGRAFCEF